jgi:5-methylthioadenosine/S-adenosylhomocysteine deaminase
MVILLRHTITVACMLGFMQNPVMHDLLIRNATVINSTRQEATVLTNHDVAISGKFIHAIEKTGRLEAHRIVNANGTALLPGFINTHAHSAMVLFRGAVEDVTPESWFNDYIWRMETNLTPDNVYWGTMLAALEMIESGVTTVADHYFMMDSVAKAFLESGLRAHLAPTMFGNDDELIDAECFYHEWQDRDERIKVWLGPHSPYLCSSEFLQKTLALAKKLNIGIHLHVSETKGQVQASLEQHYLTPPAYIHSLGLTEVPLLFAHAANATREDIALMAQHTVGVAHCPKTFLKLALGIALVTEMQQFKIPVGVGSDGAASNNSLDMLEQLRLAAMLQKHQAQDATILKCHEALAMATSEGAKVLCEKNLGQIKEGFLADLILVNLEGAHVQPVHDMIASLVYSSRASDVDTVIINGNVILEHREHKTIDKARVLREVQQCAPRLVKRNAGQKLQEFPG